MTILHCLSEDLLGNPRHGRLKSFQPHFLMALRFYNHMICGLLSPVIKIGHFLIVSQESRGDRVEVLYDYDPHSKC